MQQYKNTSYCITDSGDVYRKGKQVPLKPDCSDRGYKRVTLSINGVTERYLVHRMVAETFLQKIEGKNFINHIDNDPSNNSVSNLEWCTESENMIHCHRQNRCSNIIASKKASEIKFKEATLKFKTLLGNNFVKVENIPPRYYIHYRCAKCSIVRKSRTDSVIFLNELITCRYCK